MKNKWSILILALPLLLIFFWIFFPGALPLVSRVWHLGGRPDILERLGALALVAGFVFFLAARVLKSGPI